MCQVGDHPAKALSGAPQEPQWSMFRTVRPHQVRHIDLFLPERLRRIHLGGALSGNPAGGHRGRGEQRGNAE